MRHIGLRYLAEPPSGALAAVAEAVEAVECCSRYLIHQVVSARQLFHFRRQAESLFASLQMQPEAVAAWDQD